MHSPALRKASNGKTVTNGPTVTHKRANGNTHPWFNTLGWQVEMFDYHVGEMLLLIDRGRRGLQSMRADGFHWKWLSVNCKHCSKRGEPILMV